MNTVPFGHVPDCRKPRYDEGFTNTFVNSWRGWAAVFSGS